MSDKGIVSTTVENGLCTITFYHPAHNSMPGYLLKELESSINEAGNNSDIKVILLKAAGNRTFCAGASFTELAGIENEIEGKTFFMGFARVINAIRKCGKIVIGRVQGKVVGGGVGLAAACDYVMASKYASVKLSELSIGIGPFVIGPAVQRKIGLSAFSQMTINAEEWQTADWAKSRGLFMEVFDTLEQLDSYLDHFIQKLLGYSGDALSELKRIFWEGTEDWDTLMEERAAMSGRLVLTIEAKDAISAFLKA